MLNQLLEVETQILLAQRLEYVEQPIAERILIQTAKVGRLINGLSRSLDPNKPTDR